MRPLRDSETAAFLTVPEAAAYLRISRSLAYMMTREHFLTGGRSGLRCVRLGHRVLVPRLYLEAIASTALPDTDTAGEAAV